jgi:signal transduction histidine kinase
MSAQLNNRISLFEVAMFAVVLGLGWGAFTAYEALRDRGPKPVVIDRPPRESVNMRELLKLYELMDFQNRCLGLADQTQSGATELRDALEGYIRSKDRVEIARYLKRGQTLQVWIDRQQENYDSRRSQDLADWLRTHPGLPPQAGQLIQLDYRAALHKTEIQLSNFLASVRISEGQSLTPELVQKRLAGASAAEQELLGLASQARTQARAIETFIAQRSADWANTNQPPALVASIPELPKPLSLQLVFYGLVVALVLQCVLLSVAFHRRLVVAPLHQKLIESHSAAEHQRKLDHFARLATGLAHEIRNPLTAINVRLFTLQKALEPGTVEHSDASLIRGEIERLDQILKNFLKLARPAESKLGVMTPGPLLHEVCELLAPQLRSQEISLKCEADEDGPFEGDASQLKQVLINLVQNAADSIGRDGTVTLRARSGEGRFKDKTAPAVILEVEDNGSGIAPEVQERLFDPFFSTKESGTGLGLPIAAKIVDQHRGRLDFETRPGRGTTFRVMLPAVPAQ